MSVCSVLLCMYLLFCCLCSKHLLHNKFSNPGRIRPLSNSIRTKFQTLNVTQGHKRSYQNPASNPVLKMPHRDTSLAIQQAIHRSQMMGTIHTCSLILGAATTFVVNTLLHKLLSNPYLSRYNSVLLSYQYLTRTQSCQLSMSTQTQVRNYQCLLLGNDLELSMPHLGHNLVNYQ